MNNIIINLIAYLPFCLIFIYSIMLVRISSIKIYEGGVELGTKLPIFHLFPKFYLWEEIKGFRIIKYDFKPGKSRYKHNLGSLRKKLIIYFSNREPYEITDNLIRDFRLIRKLIEAYKRGLELIPQDLSFCPHCHRYLNKKVCETCGARVYNHKYKIVESQ